LDHDITVRINSADDGPWSETCEFSPMAVACL